MDVNAILQTCLKLGQPQMEVARVKSSIEMTNPLPRVQADSNQLLQVFSHIINNAVNAMSERGGTITISTRCRGWAGDHSICRYRPGNE